MYFIYNIAINVPPVSKNASLNSAVEFKCVCHYCETQSWTINGTPANYIQYLNNGVLPDGPYFLSNGSKLYNMSMPASIQFNNSNIGCIVFNGTNYKESEVVRLLVQGKLQYTHTCCC